MASDTYEPQSAGLSSAEWSQQQQGTMYEVSNRRYREAQQQASDSLDASHWQSQQRAFVNDPRNYVSQSPSHINTILASRATTHGDFTDVSRVAQDIKSIMTSSKGWPKLRSAQRESLEVIATKIGRILGGDPTHKDHWDDIAGYAELVAREL